MKNQNTTKQPKQATPTPAETITAGNVQTMGERIAVRALKTCYQKGGQPFTYFLYSGLIGDITARKNDIRNPLTDGYDVAQVACTFLCGYIGKELHTPADNGETDKNGKPVDVLRACFRAVNRYIMGERQREYKRAYVDEVDESGARVFYEVPNEWDTPTATDYKQVIQTIDALNLTARQAQILRYRLRGFSVHQIAEKMSIHRKTLQEHIKAIQCKYTTYKQSQTANI